MDPEIEKKDRPDLLLATVVGAFAFLMGVQALGFAFVYDDFWTILDNGYLQGPGALSGLVDGTAASLRVPDAGRPLIVAHHWIEWQLFGSGSSAYHLMSLLWHVAASVLLYLVGLELSGSARIATAASLLFAAQPIHAEVVAVVSFREDTMICVFGLGCWLLVLHARKSVGLRRVLLSCVAGALLFLGMASKESMPVLVVALPLSTAFSLGSSVKAELINGWREYLAMALSVLAAILVRVALFGTADPYRGPTYPHPGDLWGAEGYVRVLTAARMLMAGLGQMLAGGWGQSPEYCEGPGGFSDPWSLFGLAVAAALIWTGILLRSRFRLAAAGLLFAVIAFLPTSNLVWMPNIRADRFWYLASVGFCLAAAQLVLAAGERIASRVRPDWNRAVVWIPFAVLLVWWAAALQVHLRTFRNDHTLWLEAGRDAPCHPRALTGAAVSHLRKDRLALAEGLVRRAIRLQPGYAPAYQVLGRIGLRGKEPRKALKAFRLSCRFGYLRKEECHVGMARAYLLLGRPVKAMRAVARALHIDPGEHEGHFLRAEYALRHDRPIAAVRHLVDAIVTAAWKRQGKSRGKEFGKTDPN